MQHGFMFGPLGSMHLENTGRTEVRRDTFASSPATEGLPTRLDCFRFYLASEVVSLCIDGLKLISRSRSTQKTARREKREKNYNRTRPTEANPRIPNRSGLPFLPARHSCKRRISSRSETTKQAPGLPHRPYSAMAALGEDLLGTVNKLQDLVFNTIGNDSLDLPQIVRITRARSWPCEPSSLI